MKNTVCLELGVLVLAILCGCKETVEPEPVGPEQPPIADFTASPTSGRATLDQSKPEGQAYDYRAGDGSSFRCATA